MGLICAPGGIRTPNLLIRSQMLYPLSYGRSVENNFESIAGRGGAEKIEIESIIRQAGSPKQRDRRPECRLLRH